MKKISVLFIALLLIGFLFAGCNNRNDDIQHSSIWLGDDSAVDEKSFEINKSGKVAVDFDLPQAGYIKLIAFDDTDYVEWPDEIPDFFVDFKDENGKVIYENIRISEGYIEKYKFDSGKVIAEITAENRPAKMKTMYLSWAYASDTYEPVELVYDTTSAAVADENGVARLKIYVNKPSLVRIYTSEAGIYESDCSFYVETVSGEKVTGDLSIHGTEWGSRLAFLDKGEYIIVVNGIEAVASCKVKAEKTYTAIQLDDADGMTVPVAFGLNNLNSGERNVKFVADGSEKYFVVETKGSGTFYDSVHCVDVVITDESGKVVAQSDEEYISDETVIDISGLKGEYTATLSASGTCVMEVAIIDK